jgi:hypothetical protein
MNQCWAYNRTRFRCDLQPVPGLKSKFVDLRRFLEKEEERNEGLIGNWLPASFG